MNIRTVRVSGMSLAKLQEVNRSIYGTQNNRNFDTPRMVSRAHEYSTRVLKCVRKRETEHAHYFLAMGLSWSLALANRFEIELDDELWQRFPGHCPYCPSVPCSCGKQAVDHQGNESIGERPQTFRGYQAMLKGIYPHNTVQDAAMHLAEEIGETDQAVEFYLGTHQPELFRDIVIELTDVIANICAVANCLSVDLALEMESQFSQGCPKCHEWPCAICGFTTAKFAH